MSIWICAHIFSFLLRISRDRQQNHWNRIKTSFDRGNTSTFIFLLVVIHVTKIGPGRLHIYNRFVFILSNIFKHSKYRVCVWSNPLNAQLICDTIFYTGKKTTISHKTLNFFSPFCRVPNILLIMILPYIFLNFLCTTSFNFETFFYLSICIYNLLLYICYIMP